MPNVDPADLYKSPVPPQTQPGNWDEPDVFESERFKELLKQNMRSQTNSTHTGDSVRSQLQNDIAPPEAVFHSMPVYHGTPDPEPPRSEIMDTEAWEETPMGTLSGPPAHHQSLEQYVRSCPFGADIKPSANPYTTTQPSTFPQLETVAETSTSLPQLVLSVLVICADHIAMVSLSRSQYNRAFCPES